MRKRNALFLITALAVCSCDDEDDGSTPTGNGTTMLPQPGSDAGAAPDCYTNPTTYLELINACTDAEKVAKSPVLPLLQADGGLPPLP